MERPAVSNRLTGARSTHTRNQIPAEPGGQRVDAGSVRDGQHPKEGLNAVEMRQTRIR